MRNWRLLLTVLAGSSLALAPAPSASQRAKPMQLMPGLGEAHHPIATVSREAQRHFDQGLALLYGFNHEAAVLSFERAADLDPKAAMPLWGIALGLGANINDPNPDRARTKRAFETVRRALAVSVGGPENERAYIEALAKRYSDDPEAHGAGLANDYKMSMGQLSKRYPDDLDAATLYAESAMNLRPWQLWSADGQPAEGTPEILEVLESVLRRDPRHLGANHYYIHAVEASQHPERALPSARRLAALAPAAGHLVHMPAHITMRIGDYAAAARSNADAAHADRIFIRKTGQRGLYPLMYYNHNLHFLSAAWAMAGRHADARKAAKELYASVLPDVAEMPMLEAWLAQPTFIALRFHRWNEVLQTPDPGAKLPVFRTVWRFARTTAFAAGGDAKKAEAEKVFFGDAHKLVPSDAYFGLNPAAAVLAVASAELDARISAAKGDITAATEKWRRAVEVQDSLAYDEPPGWYYPIRESLGGALLRAGKPADAEAVFRDDLARNPQNGRSLFGLWQSLKAQKKSSEADRALRDFKSAWKSADTKLRGEGL